jgi:hypothetical protein
VRERERHHHRRGEQRGLGDVAARHAQEVAEQQLAQARGDLGRECEQRAEPEQAGDRDGHAGVAAQPLVAAGERDRAGGHEHPSRTPEQQRRACERGEDEPGQHAVSERLGGVALPVEEDPDAERPARHGEDQHLGQRPPHQVARERVGQPGEHQCSWCSTATARRSPMTTSSWPYVSCRTVAVSTSAGGP